MLEGYVYYDENYPSSWISKRASKKILKFFTKNFRFKEVDAKELANIVKQEKYSKEIVIIFAQDVIPDTVVDNPRSPTPNSPIRQFMNKGNTIIWLGDVPLFYIGKANGEKSTLPTHVYKTVFYPNIITADFETTNNPIAPKNKIRITALGSQLGLKNKWDSWRPLPPPTGNPPPPSAFYVLAEYRAGNVYRVVSYIYDYTGMGLKGFIRIYDCKLDDVSEEFLEQLSDIILYRNPSAIKMILENMEKKIIELSQRLETRSQAIKSDIKEIGEKIDQLYNILQKFGSSEEVSKNKQHNEC